MGLIAMLVDEYDLRELDRLLKTTTHTLGETFVTRIEMSFVIHELQQLRKHMDACEWELAAKAYDGLSRSAKAWLAPEEYGSRRLWKSAYIPAFFSKPTVATAARMIEEINSTVQEIHHEMEKDLKSK